MKRVFSCLSIAGIALTVATAQGKAEFLVGFELGNGKFQLSADAIIVSKEIAYGYLVEEGLPGSFEKADMEVEGCEIQFRFCDKSKGSKTVSCDAVEESSVDECGFSPGIGKPRTRWAEFTLSKDGTYYALADEFYASEQEAARLNCSDIPSNVVEALASTDTAGPRGFVNKELSGVAAVQDFLADQKLETFNGIAASADDCRSLGSFWVMAEEYPLLGDAGEEMDVKIQFLTPNAPNL